MNEPMQRATVRPTEASAAHQAAPPRESELLTAMRRVSLVVGQLIVVARHEPVRFWAAVLTIVTFALLFGEPIVSLVRTWWENPDAGHGLLLAPVAGVLAWRSGKAKDAKPQVWLGGAMLLLAIVIRSGAGLAAGLTLARGALLLSIFGITVYFAGVRQVRHWWLPFSVIALAIPIPDFLMGEIALPLQLRASELGAALLRARDVPVLLAGNVIRLPGHDLFVTEACSGLRSLTALISMAVLLGGMGLRSPVWRVVLVGFSLLVAILVNGFRVFLTGFLVFFVDPKLAEGFMHLTEGFLLFLVSMALLMAFMKSARVCEDAIQRWRTA